jgi:hypothetical protein
VRRCLLAAARIRRASSSVTLKIIVFTGMTGNTDHLRFESKLPPLHPAIPKVRKAP